jgi:ribosomal subunit interface protein
MHIQVTARHETTEASRIRTFVEEELGKLDGKYDVISAEVILDQEGQTNYIKTAEINLKVRGAVLHAKESSEEIHKSIDAAIHVLEGQLKKHKELHLKPTSLKRQEGNGTNGTAGEFAEANADANAEDIADDEALS